MATKEVLQQRLEEAENVLHLLKIGKNEQTISLSGFGNVTFFPSDTQKLETYISSLRQQIARVVGGPKRTIMYTEF